MRLLFLIAVLIVGSPSFGWAQEDDGSGRRVYNRTQTGFTNDKIYNSSGASYGTGGPIMLRQMLEGRDTGASSSSAYYGGKNYRPYGIDNNSYSLALSPDDIRASRAKRDARARQLERDNMDQLRSEQAASEYAERTDAYKDKFQSTSTAPAQRPTSVRSIYRKRDSEFEMPSKVFNSIR